MADAQAPARFRATDPAKKPEQFRDYQAGARRGVKDFYRWKRCARSTKT